MRKRVIGWVCGLSLLMLAVAGAQSASALIEQLRSGNLEARQKAVSGLVQAGSEAIAPLIKLLDDADPGTARWARMAIEAVFVQSSAQEAKAVEREIRTAVRSPASLKAQRTLLRLLALRSSADSVPVLESCLTTPDLREEARAALEKTPGIEATNALERAYDKANDPAWKAALLQALGARGDKHSLPILLGAIHPDQNPEVLLAAVRAAGAFADQESFDELKLSSPRYDILVNAIDSMMRITEAWLRAGKKHEAEESYRWFLTVHPEDCSQGSLTEEEKAHLINQMRNAALLGLGRLRSTDQLETILRGVGHRSYFGQAAVSILLEWDDPEVAKALLDQFSQADEQTQVVVLFLLGHQSKGAEAVLPTVRDKVRHANPRVRVAAISALAQLNDSLASEEVLRLLEDPDADVQQAAFNAATPIALAMKRAGKGEAAVDFAQDVLSRIKDPGQMRQIADTLRAVGGRIELSELAARQGFVTKWQALGPLPDRNALRDRDLIDPSKPPDPNQVVTVGNERLMWKTLYLQDPLGIVECNVLIASQDNVGAYLYTEVYAETVTPALFKIGSDDDVFCWLNGTQVHAFRGDRGLAVDQDTAQVAMQAGWNRVLIKVLNGGGPWGVCLRITDREGKPLQLKQR